MSEATVIEALLLRWNEGPNGRTVTFQLPDDTPQHPFRGLKAGPTHGQRLALSIALIADDETQSPPADNQPKEKGKSRAQMAGILCADARFRRFLAEDIAPCEGVAVFDLDMAADAVRHFCEVSSRSELDTNDQAQWRWDTLVGHYKAWLAVAA